MLLISFFNFTWKQPKSNNFDSMFDANDIFKIFSLEKQHSCTYEKECTGFQASACVMRNVSHCLVFLRQPEMPLRSRSIAGLLVFSSSKGFQPEKKRATTESPYSKFTLSTQLIKPNYPIPEWFERILSFCRYLYLLGYYGFSLPVGH